MLFWSDQLSRKRYLIYNPMHRQKVWSFISVKINQILETTWKLTKLITNHRHDYFSLDPLINWLIESGLTYFHFCMCKCLPWEENLGSVTNFLNLLEKLSVMDLKYPLAVESLWCLCHKTNKSNPVQLLWKESNCTSKFWGRKLPHEILTFHFFTRAHTTKLKGASVRKRKSWLEC